MKKVALGCLLAIVVVGVMLALSVGGIYNSLVSQSQAVDKQWAQVQNVYQRRADLIPNLVSTVAGAANFEKTTLEDVTNARASVGKVEIDASKAPTDPAQLAAFQKAQDGLSSALSHLLVISENYPQLTATAGFRDLQVQLEGTENRISVERKNFNDVVQTYNTSVKQFPNVIFAGMFGFQTKPYFEAQAGAETPPKVQFDFSGAGTAKPAGTAPATP